MCAIPQFVSAPLNPTPRGATHNVSTSTDCHISVIYRIAFIYRALYLNLDCMIMYDNYGTLLLIFLC